jgi:phosphoribosyl 1,2-cyclic phosphodiesterase
MGSDEFLVRFWGTRGSVPVSGPEFRRYGGNTACIEMRCGPHTLIFDAGSGFRPAGLSLMRSGVDDFDVFFTHCHYDHILGLPFFAPLYKPNNHITVWSGHLAGIMTTREMLRAFMKPPWFPVPLDICHANITCNDFRANDVLRPREGVTMRTGNLNHPGNCVGYRIEWAGKAVALISDTEHVEGVLDPNVLALIKDADLVIYDSNFVEDEMERYRGWGHSTWEQGIRLCEAAGARRLALFHHDKGRTDAQLGLIERSAKKRFAGALAARDGLELTI